MDGSETQDGEDIVPERSTAFVGWADEDHFYLDKDAAYAAVSGFAQRGGILSVSSPVLYSLSELRK